MTITRAFVWSPHSEYDDENFCGWRPAQQPTFDPVLEGYAICHDALEHFSPTDSTMEHEMLAFGSMLYFRGETDWWAAKGELRQTCPAYQMHMDVHEFVFEKTVDQGLEIADPGRTNPLDTDVEDIMWRMHLILRKQDEWSDEYNTQLQRAFGWMRKGYRKATHRWNLKLHERLELFMALDDHFEKYIGKDREFFEGDRLIFKIDKERLCVSHTIEHIADEHDY